MGAVPNIDTFMVEAFSKKGMENLYGSKLKNRYGEKPDHVKLKPVASD